MATNHNGIVVDDNGIEILSDTPIPPGETIREGIEYLGITEGELADKTNLPIQIIREILLGERAITRDLAASFEKTLGIPASMLLNLEARYQRTLSRKKEHEMASELAESAL